MPEPTLGASSSMLYPDNPVRYVLLFLLFIDEESKAQGLRNLFKLIHSSCAYFQVVPFTFDTETMMGLTTLYCDCSQVLAAWDLQQRGREGKGFPSPHRPPGTSFQSPGQRLMCSLLLRLLFWCGTGSTEVRPLPDSPQFWKFLFMTQSRKLPAF